MRKIKTKKKLPNTMSGLIRVGLADLRATERQKKTYRIDMSQWHQPNSHCSVCFAGSVMAQSLGANPRRSYFPDEFSATVKRKLNALNDLRCGEVKDAAERLWKDTAPRKLEKVWRKLLYNMLKDVHVTPYFTSPEEFKADMTKLATQLEQIGL